MMRRNGGRVLAGSQTASCRRSWASAGLAFGGQIVEIFHATGKDGAIVLQEKIFRTGWKPIWAGVKDCQDSVLLSGCGVAAVVGAGAVARIAELGGDGPLAESITGVTGEFGGEADGEPHGQGEQNPGALARVVFFGGRPSGTFFRPRCSRRCRWRARRADRSGACARPPPMAQERPARGQHICPAENRRGAAPRRAASRAARRRRR